MDEKTFLTVDEVAELLSVSKSKAWLFCCSEIYEKFFGLKYAR